MATGWSGDRNGSGADRTSDGRDSGGRAGNRRGLELAERAAAAAERNQLRGDGVDSKGGKHHGRIIVRSNMAGLAGTEWGGSSYGSDKGGLEERARRKGDSGNSEGGNSMTAEQHQSNSGATAEQQQKRRVAVATGHTQGVRRPKVAVEVTGTKVAELM